MTDRKQRGKRSNSEVSSSSSSSTSSFSSDDEEDARDLKPIRGYLLNRRELSRQLFRSVKTEKIRMMLPQILKNMNLNDLEEWCASELYGMSEARILSILNGQPMLDSSNTSDTDDSGPSLEIISDTEEWLTDSEVPIKEEPSSSGTKKSKRVKPNKAKNKLHGARKTEQDKLRAKAKATVAGGSTIESDVTVVKKEKENQAGARKEGESLLDLLELEMRARAIRALIRKEEDVIPSAASEKRMALTANALRNTLNSAVSASLSSEKSLNGKFNLGEAVDIDNDKNSGAKIPGRSVKSTEVGEDEDVVFVVAQPTPTIELLSSDNENDEDNNAKNSTSTNNKNDNKRDADNAINSSAKSARQSSSKNDKNAETAPIRELPTVTSDRVVTINKAGDGTDNLKIVITKRVSESSSSQSPTKSSKSKKSSAGKMDKNDSTSAASVNEKSGDNTANTETTQVAKGLFKKIRKKQHLRSKRKTVSEDASNNRDQESEKNQKSASPSPVVEVNETESEKKDESEKKNEAEKNNDDAPVQPVSAVKVEISDDSPTKTDEREVRRKFVAKSDDDRLDDFEEIIDLDAYPEDIDEIENTDNAKSTSNEEENGKQNQNQPTEVQTKSSKEEPIAKDAAESAETWASRYYQTDDVQNVIKESKIQSEIRKRLRERQRLSKLNSSPKLNCPGEATVVSEKSEEKINEPKPTGSVQEYLALKNAGSSPVETAAEVCNENLSPVAEPTIISTDLPTNSPVEEALPITVPPESETND